MKGETADVLIVDDDPQFARLVATVAEGCGLRPRLAGSLAEAWRALDPAPEVVVLDLNLPGGDGVEALRELARRGCRSRIHILSGSDPRLLRSASHLGAQLGLHMGEALAKPVAIPALRAVFAGTRRLASPPPAAAADGDGEPPTVAELRQALEHDELFLVFQPILDLSDLAPLGTEALVRWRHPARGVVPPGRFVPLAERSGLAAQMTERILALALAFAGRADYLWRGEPLSISVNVATGALVDGDPIGRVAALLAEHRVAAHRLVVEVTESAMDADRTSVLEVVSRLRLRGVEVSIDDFGTGASSLERVDQFPCTELKIERAFVADVLRRPAAAEIVRSTVGLAARLGLRTVGEGIEDAATLRWLRDAGCAAGQGFLFTRGLEPAELLAWLSGWETRRVALLASLSA
ncbi:MAG: EAL domain-containing protein [Thermoanaerobaculia bacterium]|nr:EAL domain-containing protein [Thermoanaerobaculia bacterium]